MYNTGQGPAPAGGGSLAGLLGGLTGPAGAFGLSMLPMLLSRLGLFGQDPNEELRKRLAQISDPSNQMKLSTGFYNQFVNSPVYSQAQSSIAGGANTALNTLRQSLGSRGLGTTGIGNVAPAITSSLAGSNLGKLQASAYTTAQQQANDAIQNQIRALLGGGAGPSQGQQFAGVGLDALLKYILAKYAPAQNPALQGLR